MGCREDHTGDEFLPDERFCCKVKYMRENGGMSVHYRYGGKKAFHGPTIRERAEREHALAAANGTSLRPINPTYDKPSAYSGGSK